MAENSTAPEIYMVQTSTQQSKPSIIRETNDDIEFRACLQEGDKLNRNNKIYPSALIAKAAAQEAIQEQLRMRCWHGEANHPMAPDINRQLYIDNKNISHTILSFEQKGSNFYGNILTWPEGQGKAMKGAIKQGGIISFSLRGLHKLVKDPNRAGSFIVNDLRIFTYDWVDFPSHHGAHMVPASESAAWHKEAKVPVELINRVLASESAGVLGMYQDFFQNDLEASITKDGLILKANDDFANIRLKNKITKSIISEYL